MCVISYRGQDVAMVSLEPFPETKYHEREFHKHNGIVALHYVRFVDSPPIECFEDRDGLDESIQLSVAELYEMFHERLSQAMSGY
jgi:hypothetical protein